MVVTSFPPSLSISSVLAHSFAIVVLFITCRGALNFQNITDALAFYGVYHRNPTNQLIHFFGVPCIIWSLLVFLSHLKIPLLSSGIISGIQIPLAQKHDFNYATLLTIGYILFYIHLDKFGGILYAPFAYIMYTTAVNVQINDQIKAKQETSRIKKLKEKKCQDTVSWIGTGKALKIASIVHFTGWYVQIHPGHGIFEGAKPAVMQSIGGALTSAPLFAYYEALWYVGLNKELQIQTKELVDEYTKQLCDEGVTMRACADYN